MSKAQYIGAVLVTGIILSNIAFSLVPQAALSFWAQTILGPGLLAAWIYVFRKRLDLNILWAGVLAGICFQAILAWWQYWTQTSLGGYWLAGQPDFTSILLTKTQISSEVFVLPYGSTPHPNVLAAWFVLGILILWQRFFVDKMWLRLLIGVVLLFPLAWTESWSAWLTLVILILISEVKGWVMNSSHARWLGVLMVWMILTFGCILLPMLLPGLKQNPSWSHRATLLMSTPHLLLERPQGWGVLQHPLGYSPQEKQELRNLHTQPIHSAGIAAAVDLGFWSLLLLITFLIIVQKKYSLFVFFFLLSLPIFSLDHFGYSTMSGQNLIILFYFFMFNKLISNRPRTN